MAVLFNTLEVHQLLVDAGIEKDHSDAIVKAMEKAIDGDTIATKADLKAQTNEMTIRFGAMMLTGIGLLTVVLKFL